jgi:hypothetical protein
MADLRSYLIRDELARPARCRRKDQSKRRGVAVLISSARMSYLESGRRLGAFHEDAPDVEGGLLTIDSTVLLTG